MIKSMDRLFRPKSIAVFGGKEAGRVVEQCLKLGFAGDIWPVHPKNSEVHGLKCYPSLEDLPGVPDACFVGVNRVLTIEIIAKLSKMGAGGAVCYASGFLEAISELADGGELQKQLVEAAGDMPIIGPNCYGLVNALDGALLWPDQHGCVRVNKGVAIITQSSNIAINISMQTRGLPIAYLLTAGNQAQTGLTDLAAAALDDPRVTAVGLHVEGFNSITGLETLARRSRELGKPVIMLKVGKSEAAQLATVSHTASLAGNDAVSGAILERLGIGRVHSLSQLIETLKLLNVVGPLKGRSVASMSCSGGEASMMADAGVGRKVTFRALQDHQRPPLREALGEMVTLANPLDYHTFVWGNFERTKAAFSAMMSGGFDLTMLILDFPRPDRCNGADWELTVRAMIEASRDQNAKAAVVASLAENMPETMAEWIIREGLAPLCGVEDALAACEIAASIGEAWARPFPPALLPQIGEPETTEILSEYDAKQWLKQAGVPVPKGLKAANPQEAAEAAEKIGFPVVLKGLGIAHKTEAGAVVLNLKTPDDVIAGTLKMAAVTSEFLVEDMVGKPVAELIVGAFRDPVVGLVMTIGAGGILVELIDDSALLTLPTDKNTIETALSGLKVNRLLTGYRNNPKGDRDALIDAIMKIAGFIAANTETLEELDINPLMVLPEGSGVVAADALIKRRVRS
ncbi:MAG: hypothetical protein RIR97_1280 [Pseudomonadota bacterium]